MEIQRLNKVISLYLLEEINFPKNLIVALVK